MVRRRRNRDHYAVANLQFQIKTERRFFSFTVGLIKGRSPGYVVVQSTQFEKKTTTWPSERTLGSTGL